MGWIIAPVRLNVNLTVKLNPFPRGHVMHARHRGGMTNRSTAYRDARREGRPFSAAFLTTLRMEPRMLQRDVVRLTPPVTAARRHEPPPAANIPQGGADTRTPTSETNAGPAQMRLRGEGMALLPVFGAGARRETSPPASLLIGPPAASASGGPGRLTLPLSPKAA